MIAKCIAVLAIVAQINAYCVNQVVPSGSQVVLGSSGVAGVAGLSTGAGIAGLSSGVGITGLSTGAGVAGVSSGVGATVKNIVANGKYPVALTNCGPNPDTRVPVTTSAVSTPVQEKPTVNIPTSIPAPRTVSHTCTCYKTVLKPRVHQQIITVPSVQRYIQTTHRPVIENIQYEAVPVNCYSDNVASGVVGTSGVLGATGVVGTSGVLGASGVVGTSGVLGVSGVVGTSGVLGATGVVGTSGVLGASALPAFNVAQTVAVPQVQAIQPVAVGSLGSCAC